MFKKVIFLITLSSLLATKSFPDGHQKLNEVRIGAGLPFTFIASTSGVIHLNGHLEYARRLSHFMPFFKLQYSSYHRVSRKKGQLIATRLDTSLSGLDAHLGMKYRIKRKKFEIRPFISYARGLGTLKQDSIGLDQATSYGVYSTGVELLSLYQKKYFLSFAGTVSKSFYSGPQKAQEVTLNRPTLELHFGILF